MAQLAAVSSIYMYKDEYMLSRQKYEVSNWISHLSIFFFYLYMFNSTFMFRTYSLYNRTYPEECYEFHPFVFLSRQHECLCHCLYRTEKTKCMRSEVLVCLIQATVWMLNGTRSFFSLYSCNTKMPA